MNTTKTRETAHSNCTHARTKSARALCRKTRTTVETVTTDYGTFQIKTVKAKDLTKNDMVLYRPETLAPFFSGVTYDAFQCERVNPQTQQVEKTDTYRLDLGGPSKFVPGDTEYVVAVEPKAVKDAQWAYKRSLTARFGK